MNNFIITSISQTFMGQWFERHVRVVDGTYGVLYTHLGKCLEKILLNKCPKIGGGIRFGSYHHGERIK